MGTQDQGFLSWNNHEAATLCSVETTPISLSAKQDNVKYSLLACFYFHGGDKHTKSEQV